MTARWQDGSHRPGFAEALSRKYLMLAAMEDPEFLKEAAQQRVVIEVTSGEELQQVVGRVLATPKDLVHKAAEVRN